MAEPTPTTPTPNQRAVIVVRERRDKSDDTPITAVHLGPALVALLKANNFTVELFSVEEQSGGPLHQLKLEGPNSLNSSEKKTLIQGLGLEGKDKDDGKVLLGMIEGLESTKVQKAAKTSAGIGKKIALRD